MANFQQTVKQAGDLLLASDVSKQTGVKEAWESVEWQAFDRQVNDAKVERSQAGDCVIRLYPLLLSDVKAPRLILREFGALLLDQGGDAARNVWDKKLILPSELEVRLFADKLKDAAVRKGCLSYADLIKTYPDRGHSVERLVGIHFANALLANNVPFSDSVGVNIYTWGATAQFAKGDKCYSLIPLTSAYCPGEIHANFGDAFASRVVENLRPVQDLSVATGLREIIRSVLEKALTFRHQPRPAQASQA